MVRDGDEAAHRWRRIWEQLTKMRRSEQQRQERSSGGADELEQRVYEASASSNPSNLKLIFSDDEINSPVFTKQKITGKRGGKESIKVILLDANTQQEITTGPVASAKVKIVLLRGDYDGSTTMEDGEFEKNIIVSWGKKKNALVGDLEVFLKHGRGTIGEIRIQHDKHPIKNVEFRLGAMVVDCPKEVKVKHAITQSFKVKDLRIAPKSFRPLSPTDKVWQLKNIRKHGPIHKRLESLNVYTVKDFLNMYYSNPQTLQEIYRVKGKNWETTVNHAITCNAVSTDNNFYSPRPYENDYYGSMIVDEKFSINDVDIEYYDMDMCLHDERLLPCVPTRVRQVKGFKAKKRWMKMRTFMFSVTFFICSRNHRRNHTG
ncbi:hypothetical protein LXL04_030695 [Taraxacum kok-saghyz]